CRFPPGSVRARRDRARAGRRRLGVSAPGPSTIRPRDWSAAMNQNAPAAHMTAEMAEQPTILARFASRFDTVVADVRDVAGSGVAGVAFLARGSSDNAALLGRYAVELGSGLPTCLVAPSVATAYERHPTGFVGWLVVALSQSGRTPEIVDLAEQFGAAGAVVVGGTHDTAPRVAAGSRP